MNIIRHLPYSKEKCDNYRYYSIVVVLWFWRCCKLPSLKRFRCFDLHSCSFDGKKHSFNWISIVTIHVKKTSENQEDVNKIIKYLAESVDLSI